MEGGRVNRQGTNIEALAAMRMDVRHSVDSKRDQVYRSLAVSVDEDEPGSLAGTAGSGTIRNSRLSMSGTFTPTQGKAMAALQRTNTMSSGRVVANGILPISDFSLWLEDQMEFSKQLSVPLLEGSEKQGFLSKFFGRMGAKKEACSFALHVHGVDGLPPELEGKKVVVRWQRKDSMAETRPVKVVNGLAEIEQTMQLRGTLYRSSGSSKYMPKPSKLSTVLIDSKATTIGQDLVDLSKVIPTNLGIDNPPHTSSFSLTGPARGSSLVVTFGYEIQLKNNERRMARVESRTWKAAASSSPGSRISSATSSPISTPRAGGARSSPSPTAIGRQAQQQQLDRKSVV